MAKTITRIDLSSALKEKFGLSRQESVMAVDHILSEVLQVLKDHGEIKIPLFGVLFSRQKKARVGRNPKTLKEAVITARSVAGFRVSRLMKQRINGSQKKRQR